MKKLRIIVYFSPAGLKYPAYVRFTDKKENLLGYTKGEGTAISFVAENWDASTLFDAALRDGRFLKDSRDGEWSLVFNPYTEKELKTLEKMRG